MEIQHTNADLKELQSLDLEHKIQVTQTRILEYGLKLDKQIYISFSGGKDSTVLLDIVRKVFPETPAVFCDTGLEYPEIREFVKTIDNVEWIYPQKWDKHKRKYVRTSFKEVINTYGYPLVSKEISQVIAEAKRSIAKGDFNNRRVQKVRGELMWNGEKSPYNCDKWAFLMDAPFDVSEKCCRFLKKNPFKAYEKQTKRYPIVGSMAQESRFRKQVWLRYGCNTFQGRIMSRPMSFWTEQDVLQYIKKYNLPYASIYGDIYEDAKGLLYTTGVDRTGYIFCGFGAHLEKEPNRFQKLKVTHPQLWEYCMKSTDKGGVGMREPLEYIGVKIE